MKHRQGFQLIPILFFFLTIVMSSTCEKEPPKLSREHKAIIDTLVKRQTVLLRAELDSLCEVDFDEKVRAATDSLVKVRIEEINRQFR